MDLEPRIIFLTSPKKITNVTLLRNSNNIKSIISSITGGGITIIWYLVFRNEMTIKYGNSNFESILNYNFPMELSSLCDNFSYCKVLDDGIAIIETSHAMLLF